MAVSVTNRKTCQSLRAQSVIVTLDTSESENLKDIEIGQKATLDSNGKIGYVCRVDKFGNSFEVNPAMPVKDFASDNIAGYLMADESITIE
jgi:hypothetical protein